MAMMLPKAERAARLALVADTAGDMMSDRLISLRHDAGVHEAVILLTDRGFDAAPVIDENGRPVGVITVTDLLVYDREKSRLQGAGAQDDGSGDGSAYDHTRVDEMMTPMVFTVSADTPAAEVVRRLLNLNVHHLFVADRDGVLIGVISACDILRQLA